MKALGNYDATTRPSGDLRVASTDIPGVRAVPTAALPTAATVTPSPMAAPTPMTLQAAAGRTTFYTTPQGLCSTPPVGSRIPSHTTAPQHAPAYKTRASTSHIPLNVSAPSLSHVPHHTTTSNVSLDHAKPAASACHIPSHNSTPATMRVLSSGTVCTTHTPSHDPLPSTSKLPCQATAPSTANPTIPVTATGCSVAPLVEAMTKPLTRKRPLEGLVDAGPPPPSKPRTPRTTLFQLESRATAALRPAAIMPTESGIGPPDAQQLTPTYAPKKTLGVDILPGQQLHKPSSAPMPTSAAVPVQSAGALSVAARGTPLVPVSMVQTTTKTVRLLPTQPKGPNAEPGASVQPFEPSRAPFGPHTVPANDTRSVAGGRLSMTLLGSGQVKKEVGTLHPPTALAAHGAGRLGEASTLKQEDPLSLLEAPIPSLKVVEPRVERPVQQNLRPRTTNRCAQCLGHVLVVSACTALHAFCSVRQCVAMPGHTSALPFVALVAFWVHSAVFICMLCLWFCLLYVCVHCTSLSLSPRFSVIQLLPPLSVVPETLL